MVSSELINASLNLEHSLMYGHYFGGFFFFVFSINSAKKFGNKNDSDDAFWPNVHTFEGDWYRTTGEIKY